MAFRIMPTYRVALKRDHFFFGCAMCYASCATFRRIPVSLILRDVSSHLQFNLLLKYRPNFNDQSLKKIEYIYIYIYIHLYIYIYIYI